MSASSSKVSWANPWPFGTLIANGSVFGGQANDSSLSTVSIPFVYDEAGNTEAYPAGEDNQYKLVYDAWNRPVQVDFVEDPDGTPTPTTILKQQYNGLHWRTVVQRDTDLVPNGMDQMRVLSYDASWRLLEEQVDDGWSPSPGTFTVDRTLEQFWGIRYVDDPILRRPDPEVAGGYWHITDAQFSTMALLDNSANVYERVWYTPYGEARHHWGQDFDGDRDFDIDDGQVIIDFLTLHGLTTPINDPNYVVELDRNRDGVIDFDDYPSGSGQTAVALGQISDLDATSGPDNWIGYAGYVWEGASSLYHVRFRNYSPGLGRWMQRDPLLKESGKLLQAIAKSPLPDDLQVHVSSIYSREVINAYRYVAGQPTSKSDATGLAWWEYIPIVDSIVSGLTKHLTLGIDPSFYATCGGKASAEGCKRKGVAVAEQECVDCVRIRSSNFIVGLFDDDAIPGEATKLLIDSIVALLVKNSARSAMGLIGVGDLLAETYMTMDNLTDIQDAAVSAIQMYCNCRRFNNCPAPSSGGPSPAAPRRPTLWDEPEPEPIRRHIVR